MPAKSYREDLLKRLLDREDSQRSRNDIGNVNILTPTSKQSK